MHGSSKGVKKHERVTLEKENDAATCDICQENKAIMFCSEDRALICRRWKSILWNSYFRHAAVSDLDNVMAKLVPPVFRLLCSLQRF